jgi:hypothetical protein
MYPLPQNILEADVNMHSEREGMYGKAQLS